jgi:hypothetical protein
MPETITFPVNHNGTEKVFAMTTSGFGNARRFHIDIDGTTFTFEPNEEGAVRALLPPGFSGDVPEAGYWRK